MAVLCFVIEADQIAFETEAAAVEVPAPAEIAPAVVAAAPALKAVPKETAAPARGENRRRAPASQRAFAWRWRKWIS